MTEQQIKELLGHMVIQMRRTGPMKRFLVISAIVICGVAACVGLSHAQQPPADARIETYKFLLNEANSRLADANGALSAAQAENAQLKAQIEKRKKEDDDAAKAAPKK